MITLEKENDLNFDGGVVLKFHAEWCAPCKRLDGVIKKMEKEFESIKIYCVDVDKIPNLAKEYKIMSVPTLIFFKNTKEAERIVGMVLTEPLRKAFKRIDE
jgi:thioredoxin 1